jgi:hypothetical protein
VNVFVLDTDPILAAQYHCDVHVSKMLLETCQLLSTVSILEGRDAPYKPTHASHPCTLWALDAPSHYSWLWRLGAALSMEFAFRRGKRHACADVLMSLKRPGLPRTLPARFMIVVDERITECDDPVLAYRLHYHLLPTRFKRNLVTWTRREAPAWWTATER